MRKDVLRNLGLTDGEIRIYQALLTLGEVTSGPIILKSKVSRSKVYELLERLKEKGLVTDVIEDGVRHFRATHPSRLLDLVKEQEQEIARRKEELELALPALVNKYTEESGHEEARVYVGYDGVKAFLREVLSTLTSEDEYLVMTFLHTVKDKDNILRMFKQFHEERAQIGFKARILGNIPSKKVKDAIDLSYTGNYEFRRTDVVLPTGIEIHRDVVSMFNWGKTPRVFSIRCKENADQYRAFFNGIWKKSKL